VSGTQRIPISFGFQSRPGRYGQDGTVRVINAMPEEAGDEGKKKLIHYAIDGLRTQVTLPVGPIRAVLAVNQYLLVCAAYNVYRVAADWTYELIGYVDTLGYAKFVRGRRETDSQVVLISGGRAYIITGTATYEGLAIAELDDPDLPQVNSVTHIDGYFTFGIADSTAGRFFLTAQDDASQVAALDYATAESNPDPMVTVFRRKGELWLFGSESLEIWTNSGNELFPFERLPGATIDRGCKSGPSVVLLDEKVIWISDDGTVVLATGYAGERISTHSVERSITAEPDKSAIQAEVITKNGHSLYILSGTTFTWVYNLTTKLWHERKSLGLERWRGGPICEWRDQTVVGDIVNGKLYTVDPTYADEGDQQIVMLLRGPILHNFPNDVQYFDLCLDIVRGVGVVSGDDEDTNPRALLRYSDDGGATWSNERTGELGQTSKTGNQIKFPPMGQASDIGRVVELSISAGVMRALMGATAKIRSIPRR